MKILYIITKATWGGAARYVFDLATAAKAAGHEVSVAYGTEGPLSERLASEGVETVHIPGLARDIGAFQELRALIAIFRLMRRLTPQVVHLNSAKAWAIGVFAARLASVPRIIATAHGWGFNEERPWWQQLVFYFGYAGMLWLTDTVICVSEKVRRDVRSVPFIKAKMRVIHNGIVCIARLSKEAALRELAPPTVGSYWIGMLAELHPTKRVEDAVRAMKSLIAKHPEAVLIVLGEGELRQELARLIKDLGLTRHVFLTGFRENAAVLLSAFDLLLMPSRSEGLPYTLLEAGCASLPVVASNVGGIPEIIENEKTGILIPPLVPERIAEAALYLIENPDRARDLGQHLHEKILTEFSLQRMVSETFRVYP